MGWFRRKEPEPEPEPEPQPLTVPVFVSLNGLQKEAVIEIDPSSTERAQLWIEGDQVSTEHARGRSLQVTVWTQ